MTDNTRAILKMADSISKLIHMEIDNYRANNKIFKAKIIEVVSSKKYQVLYCGQKFTVTSGISCEVGDYVRVCVNNGNWEDLFVVCKA